MIKTLLNSDVQAFIKAHEQDNPARLLLSHGQKEGFPIKEAVAQIEARKIAKNKLPLWYNTRGIILPPRVSMEQCSSEATARYKASLISGEEMLDLTGGSGADTFFLAQCFKKATYIEHQTHLADLAAHNFKSLGAEHIQCINMLAEEFLQKNKQHYDLIYIDPARRGEAGQKVFLLSDCQPDVARIQDLLLKNAKQIMIKLSPMLDVKLALQSLYMIPFDVHIVAVDNEVKELLLYYPGESTSNSSTQMHCINLDKNGNPLHVFRAGLEDEQVQVQFGEPDTYLYEPNAAIMKAGLFKTIAEHFDLTKLHPNSHLYSSSDLISGFPGRIFRLIAKSPAQKKALRQVLPEMKANLTVRNFPADAKSLIKKLGLQEGGSHYLFATTLANNEKCLLIGKKTV